MRYSLLIFLAAAVPVLGQQTNQRNSLIFAPGAKEPTVLNTPTPTPAPAAPLGKTAAPDDIISAFFLALKADQVDAAYDALVRNTIIAERQKDVDGLKAKTKEAIDGYGPISGFEIVDEREVGTVLMRRTCISLNSDLPLRWRFYFYKTQGEWRLVDLRIDDGLVELFEDSARVRR
ncbi:MAG: hypothetical protein BGO12_15445 [Verrucomicrobia bacterium 61-8]|nr:hypothetical protein [Verrucomicrobiota bacterium]OJV03774.1 MAG: hypothetical protein BGO12_15445 [Verrucomicrobia bacterium 61-8]